MSPRGVAIPQIREQLFRAAERILRREGPAGLTSRAITTEAGCAKGLLYRHFADLDEFLAELLVSRFGLIAEQARTLPLRPGTGTVAGNLAAAVLALAETHGFTLASLLAARPRLARQLADQPSGGRVPGIEQIEDAFSGYLEAEKERGRVAADADTRALAISLVGAVHHLFLTGRAGEPDLRRRVHEIADAITAGIAIG